MKRYQLPTQWLFSGKLCLVNILGLLCGLGWIAAADVVTPVQVQAQSVSVTNAASFAPDVFAPDSLAAAFGSFVTTGNQTFVASTLPLPTTLGGLRVTVNGSDSGILVTSPGQINFLLPPNLPDGANSVVVTNADSSTRQTTITIQRSAAGIFTARSNGLGAAAAVVTSDGVNYQSTANPDGTEREISAGTKDRPNFLVLFATGVRNAVAANPNDANGVAEAVTATVQGVPAQVTYAGRSGTFAGLDQINLILPPELSGVGIARVRLSIAGRGSNVATVLIGGQPPVIRADAISAGASVAGTLTVDDQVQALGDGRTYFFDAYRFRTTTANTTVSVDLRSAQFDATVAIAQQDANGRLVFLAADDQNGGLGNGKDDNNNALLLTVLRDAGDYLILATSADGAPDAIGSYQLSLNTGTLQQLNYSATPVIGSISNTDVQTSAGDYLDAYWFTGSAGEFVQVKMSSTAFDSFVILNASNGDLLAFDDNGGGGSDSLLTFRLPASGNYVLIVTPFEPQRTGAYTLTVNRINQLGAEPGEVRASALGRTLDAERGMRRMQFDRFASRYIVTRE